MVSHSIVCSDSPFTQYYTVSPPVISWSMISPITDLLDTQYSVVCITNGINPTTLVYWTVNGITVTNNTDYTLVDETDNTYNNTLILYPNNEQGQSVTVTCSVEGVRNDTVILKGLIFVFNACFISMMLRYFSSQ